mmetsp:Transcript_5610/g.17644  ORF Transcript_5610/g.17644 Transcript_5610/m.17644 type:complete len:263 (+) Transcript_5610:1122-1910(+)
MSASPLSTHHPLGSISSPAWSKATPDCPPSSGASMSRAVVPAYASVVSTKRPRKLSTAPVSQPVTGIAPDPVSAVVKPGLSANVDSFALCTCTSASLISAARARCVLGEKLRIALKSSASPTPARSLETPTTHARKRRLAPPARLSAASLRSSTTCDSAHAASPRSSPSRVSSRRAVAMDAEGAGAPEKTTSSRRGMRRLSASFCSSSESHTRIRLRSALMNETLLPGAGSKVLPITVTSAPSAESRSASARPRPARQCRQR